MRALITFLTGSALGAGVDYGLTLALVSGAGLGPSLALALSMLVSATLVFFFHDRLTFAHEKPGPAGARLVRFLGWSALVWALRALALEGLLTLSLPLWLALGLSIVAVSLVNFAVSQRVIFRAAP